MVGGGGHELLHEENGVKNTDSQGSRLETTAGGQMGMSSSPCPGLDPGLGSVGSKGLSEEPR